MTSSASRQNAYRATAGSRMPPGSSRDAAWKLRDPPHSSLRQASMSAASVSECSSMRHHAIQDFCGGNHRRHACPRMRAGADQVEAGNIFALVMRTEERALQQHRLQAERRAVQGQQAVAEINRRPDLRRDDMLAEV